MTYSEYGEKAYAYLLSLLQDHNWYFALRKRASATPLLGSERAGYHATSFWKINSSTKIKHVPTIALMFRWEPGRIYYTWNLRQTRNPEDPTNEATLHIVEKTLAANQYRLDRIKSSKETSKNLVADIFSPKDNYATFEEMVEDLNEDITQFIPLVDGIIDQVRSEHPALQARRIKKEEYDNRTDLHDAFVEEVSDHTVPFFAAEEWLPILRNEELIKKKDLLIFNAFLQSPNYTNNCYRVDAILKGVPESEGQNVAIGGAIGWAAKHLMNKVPAIPDFPQRRDGQPMYWRLFFTGEQKGSEFPWTLRPELAKALQQIDLPELPSSPSTAPAAAPGSPMKHPLNQILYGPPGTGKTYRAIAQAVAIVENKSLAEINNQERADVKNRYQSYVAAGQIVFTTFHQSLSYEDFVEGLKPVINDADRDEKSGEVAYEIKSGIFQKLCREASYSIAKQKPNKSTQKAIAFDRKYELLAAETESDLLESGVVRLDSRSGGKVLVDSISSQGNFRIKHEEGKRIYTVGKDRLAKLHLGLKELDGFTNIHDTFRSIIGGSNSSAYWAVLNAVRKYEVPESSEHTDLLHKSSKAEVIASLTNKDYRLQNAQSYVLIIDEINRGNVSRILGELITLLEPDKRLGADEALTVTLPYSRQEFGVPPNLYLIGTMNTADRSVVALDSALRRRFRFVEVGPDPDVIATVRAEQGLPEHLTIAGQEFNLSKIMRTINQRITFLRDADHQIGHSYFLKMKRGKDLAEQFRTGVIPLLREYFFEDDGQAQLILGEGFISSERGNLSVNFPTNAATDHLNPSDYVRYTINDLRANPPALARALNILLAQPEGAAPSNGGS